MSSSHLITTRTVLHILYNPHTSSSFILFGESCDPEKPVHIQIRTDVSVVNHPLAVDTDSLITLFNTRSKNSEIDKPVPNTRIQASSQRIEFPRVKLELIPSPEWLLECNFPGRQPESLTFCTVPVLICSPELLFSIPEKNSEQSQIEGGSFRFWKAVAQLAREMLIRGRYLPSTGIYQNGGICTRWKILPTSYDMQRIDQLARAMPPIQQRFLRSEKESSRSYSKKETVIIFIESMIARITSIAIQMDYGDTGYGFSPIERLKYSQELTALYFLQGYERHKMPITNPQLTNGWKNKFDAWTDVSDKMIPDDLPWTVIARVEELPSAEEMDDATEKSHDWAIIFLIRSADHPDILVPAKRLGQDTRPPIALPGEEELKNMLQNAIMEVQKGSDNPDLQVTYQSLFDPVIQIPESDLIRFLSHDAPRIRENGLEIIYPEWWGRPAEPTRVQFSVFREPEKGNVSMMGLQSLLHYDYRIAVGDDRIDPAAFRQMVEQQTSTVRVGKRWVTIDRQELDGKIRKIEKQYKKHRLSTAELLKIVARAENPDTDLTINPEDDWTADLITSVRKGWALTRIQIPETFIGTLRPYQETGVAFLLRCRTLGFGACLADDMGLGKTPQTIAYLLSVQKNSGLHGPSLLVCPTSIIGNWERELRRFAPGLTCFIHHGSSRLKGKDFIEKTRAYDLVITSYALIPRDLEFISGLSYAVLILDEVQNIKNPHTKQFQAVRTLEADHRIALTGTPVENHLTELWALMESINPDYLGSFSTFQKIYATPIEKGGSDEKAAELRRMIRPFFLRRVKTDTTVITDLPEKMEMQIYCTLTHEQAARYQGTVNDLARDLQSVAGIARKGRVLSALTRLKQICNYPEPETTSLMDPGRSGKIQRLIEMLEEVRDTGDAAIVFTQYATFAKSLAAVLHSTLNREILLLTGSTPRLKREEMIARFSKLDGPRFFVISLRAGGTGLNLMRANHVFHIDRWWNPAVEDQATDRAYRIGQTKTVQVHMMITAGTLEEQIHEMIERKRTVADQVISAGEEWLTELPNGELMDVLRLREEIFGDDL